MQKVGPQGQPGLLRPSVEDELRDHPFAFFAVLFGNLNEARIIGGPFGNYKATALLFYLHGSDCIVWQNILIVESDHEVAESFCIR